MKKKKRHSPALRAGENGGIDPEIYFKTMTVIQALKPLAVGRYQRLGSATDKMAAAVQRGGDGEAIEEDRQTHLPPIQTSVRDSGEGTRKSVVQRWQRAAAAAVAGTVYSKSSQDSVCLATGERTSVSFSSFWK